MSGKAKRGRSAERLRRAGEELVRGCRERAARQDALAADYPGRLPRWLAEARAANRAALEQVRRLLPRGAAMLALAALLAGCGPKREAVPPGYTVLQSGEAFTFSPPDNPPVSPVGGYYRSKGDAEAAAWRFHRGARDGFVFLPWLPVEGAGFERAERERREQDIVGVVDRLFQEKYDEQLRRQSRATMPPPFPRPATNR